MTRNSLLLTKLYAGTITVMIAAPSAAEARHVLDEVASFEGGCRQISAVKYVETVSQWEDSIPFGDARGFTCREIWDNQRKEQEA